MSEDRSHHNCNCCFIVPTRLLEKFTSSEDVKVAEAAARTIRLNASLRAFRAQLSTGAPSPAAVKRTGLRRQVFNSGCTADLPGEPDRMETDGPSRDPSVNEAFDNSGTTWKFFKEVFGRESVDGNGKTLVSSVHFGQQYQNAFWNGQQMVYGDGDGKVFLHFTGALEVIAHELTHGVTGFSAQLPYEGESGALNESMSDVFGSLVKQWALGQTVDQADWLIGAGIVGSGLKGGRALRDMANPGTAYDGDEQPGHMKDYVVTDDDHGGVHINSGIPNKAFVLAAKAIGGKAWEIPGRIWYVTLTERLTSASDFKKCANETVSVARDLYPNDPSIAEKIAAAWVSVGVLEAVPASISAALGTAALKISRLSAASDSVIAQQFSALGHTKVLVSLKKDAGENALMVAKAEKDPAAYAEAVKRDIEKFFIEPDNQQFAALAAPIEGGKSGVKRDEVRPRVRIFPRLGIALGLVDAKGLGALETSVRVKDVHAAPVLSLIKPVHTSPARAPATSTWGIKRLNIANVWEQGITGKDVLVGHLDTGVDASHPALSHAIAAFAEFDMAGNQVQGAQPHDSATHGTHTAGTIAGRPGSRGAFGVAPGAQLASALVIEGGQVIDRILAGLEWIVSQNVRILSMSVGLRGYTSAFEEVIAALRSHNILPVIAVGNEGPDTSRSPGNYEGVLSVGACNEKDVVPDWSSSQRFARADNPFVPDLVAPGVNVLSCVPGGRFAIMDGTSMATPHIAGLAALLLHAKPEATLDELEKAILDSCTLPETMPDYRANHGVPDAIRALELVAPSRIAIAQIAAHRGARHPHKAKASSKKIA